MRTNVYKNKIVQLLQKSHLLSISDIHKKITGADYSTVYRNVEQLVSEETIKKVVLDRDNVMYEMSGEKSSHDHFVCIDCGDVIEIHIVPKVRSLLQTSKCVVTDVVARGRCAKCN